MSKSRNIADIGSNDVLDTNANGIDVTGTVVADGLTVDGTAAITDNASNGGLTVEGSSSPRVIVEDTTNNAQAFLEAGDSITRVGSLSNHSLEFRTNNSAEMTLNTSGNLAIGRSDAQVAGIEIFKSQPIVRWTDSNNDSYGEIRGNNGNLAIRADEGNTESNSSISFEVDGSNVVSIYGSGLSFDGGSNYLDDYEEGTWTPAITFGGGSTGLTYSRANGRYVKIGKVVYVTAGLALSNKGSSTGAAQITGFPFNDANEITGGYFQNVNVRGSISAPDTDGSIYAYFSGAQTNFALYSSKPDGTPSSTMDNGDFANNSELDFSFAYFTTA